jgi:hypothetical protein
MNLMGADLSNTGLYDSSFYTCCLDGADLQQCNGFFPQHNIRLVNCSLANMRYESSDEMNFSNEFALNNEPKLNLVDQVAKYVDIRRFIKFNDVRQLEYLHHLTHIGDGVYFTADVLRDLGKLDETLTEIMNRAKEDFPRKALSYFAAVSLVFHIEKSDLNFAERHSLIEHALKHPMMHYGKKHTSLWFQETLAENVLFKARQKIASQINSIEMEYIDYMV